MVLRHAVFLLIKVFVLMVELSISSLKIAMITLFSDSLSAKEIASALVFKSPPAMSPPEVPSIALLVKFAIVILPMITLPQHYICSQLPLDMGVCAR